jgi:hypothetical protein
MVALLAACAPREGADTETETTGELGGAQNETCAIDYGCARGLTCRSSAANIATTCQPRGDQGYFCDTDDDCADGLVCNRNAAPWNCVSPASLSQDCNVVNSDPIHIHGSVRFASGHRQAANYAVSGGNRSLLIVDAVTDPNGEFDAVIAPGMNRFFFMVGENFNPLFDRCITSDGPIDFVLPSDAGDPCRAKSGTALSHTYYPRCD